MEKDWGRGTFIYLETVADCGYTTKLPKSQKLEPDTEITEDAKPPAQQKSLLATRAVQNGLLMLWPAVCH